MTHTRAVLFVLCLGWILALTGIHLPADAQETQVLAPRFGKNKVHYKSFQWATLETPHFTIYFYRGQEKLARNTERIIERAYQYLSATLHHQFMNTIPLIVYASSDDFQQTEIISGFLDEGIGGVTESLKGRIIVPFLGSYRSFNHVLVHELVHAFQFDIFSGGRGGLAFSPGIYLPLWFVEGMAEYLSEYHNPLTDMWLQDAVVHETLPQVNEIERMQDIRVYRFGQSIWEYIGKTYSMEIIGELLRGLAEEQTWEQVIRSTTNTSWSAIYEAWRNAILETYIPTPGQYEIGTYATTLIAHHPKNFFLNIVPAVSPDGKYVAFISDRDFFRTIYLASAETGEFLGKLVKGERIGTFESLRFLNTSIAWSPDSQHVAFNARAGGENAIYLLDIRSRKILKKLVPNVSSLSFMAWSPDNTHIAFTGTQNGQEDLFLINIENGDMIQLTDNLYSNRHPAWSPDGKTIAFSTDAGNFSQPEALKFGPSNIALYELESKQSYLLTNTPANDFTPVWSPDGSLLAFVSDRNGRCNLYFLELEQYPGKDGRQYHARKTRMFTNVDTGIVGLTEDNPALSWAQETGMLLFSGFSNRGWDIFALKNPAAHYREYVAESGFEEADGEPPSPLFSETLEKKDWNFEAEVSGEPTEAKKYSPRLRPDYLLLGGGGSHKSFALFGNVAFSDMLSERRLSVALNLTEVFDQSNFAMTYTSRARRFNYALSVFQFGDANGTFLMEDADLDVTVLRGIGGSFHWPIDKFKRIEFGLEGWMVEGDFVTETERTRADDQFFVIPSLAYVYDTSLYTYLGPLDGTRARFSLRPSIGDLTYLTVNGDYRRYFHATRRSAVAVRLVGVGSFGNNARVFEIGGPLTFRGGGLDENYDDRDRIRGTKIALGNLEYRFPLVPMADILRGTVFCDLALGWQDEVQLVDPDSDQFRFKDLRTAYGLGVRLPISGPFGLLNVRFDLAWETDFDRIGPEKFFFSVANDF